MDFSAWTRALADRGFTVVPPSHIAPVDIWALTPQGTALHFRCRGTSVTLAEYADADLHVVMPTAICGCGCGAAAAPPPSAGQFSVRPGARPIRSTGYDGRRERGWTYQEAGLLTIGQAAVLFEALLGSLAGEVLGGQLAADQELVHGVVDARVTAGVGTVPEGGTGHQDRAG